MKALDKKLAELGLKDKADSNAAASKKIKAEFKAKEKVKPLTTSERIERIEKLLGL